MREIICRCGGAIRNAEAWKLGRWSWDWLSSAFPDRISISDLDAIVESNGHLLVFETKGVGVPVEKGQRQLLEQLARVPNSTVCIIWGNPDEPVEIEIIGKGKRSAADRDRIWAIASAWSCKSGRKPSPWANEEWARQTRERLAGARQ